MCILSFACFSVCFCFSFGFFFLNVTFIMTTALFSSYWLPYLFHCFCYLSSSFFLFFPLCVVAVQRPCEDFFSQCCNLYCCWFVSYLDVMCIFSVVCLCGCFLSLPPHTTAAASCCMKVCMLVCGSWRGDEKAERERKNSLDWLTYYFIRIWFRCNVSILCMI